MQVDEDGKYVSRFVTSFIFLTGITCLSRMSEWDEMRKNEEEGDGEEEELVNQLE